MKKVLFTSLIASLFLITLASAYHVGQSETWSYHEDIQGENRGFSLTHSRTGPSYHDCNGFYYFSYDNPCTPLNSAYPAYGNQPNQGYVISQTKWDRSRGLGRYGEGRGLSYTQINPQPIDHAFKTFQDDSQLELDIQREKNYLRRAYPRSRSNSLGLGLGIGLGVGIGIGSISSGGYSGGGYGYGCGYSSYC